MLVASICTTNSETFYLKNSWVRTVNVSCKYHVCLAPCTVIHIHIVAMHIKKTTSNNEDNNNKLGLRSNNNHGSTSV